jgi:hypothetical protein
MDHIFLLVLLLRDITGEPAYVEAMSLNSNQFRQLLDMVH